VRNPDHHPPTIAGAGHPTVPRRAVLRGAAGVLAIGMLAGCDPFSAPPAPPQPLNGLLTSTVALGDRYDAAMAAVPTLAGILTQVRDAHRAHADALAHALGTTVPRSTAPPPPVPEDRARALATLASAEKAARDDAATACLSSEAGIAALIGSIAAARASHLEVLK
jgi:hypothetical protein